MTGNFIKDRFAEATSAGAYVFIGQGVYQAAQGDYISAAFALAAGLALFFVPENRNGKAIAEALATLSDAELDKRLREAREKR